MLLEFAVENFRSIADRQTLSFVAGKHVSAAEGMPAVEVPGFSAGKVLTSVVLYGANASGKSNILMALNWTMHLIAQSASPSRFREVSFRLDPEWAAKPTRFELTFLKEGTRHQYGFAVDGARVQEEWLIAYPKKAPQLWFERHPSAEKVDIHFGPSLRGEKARIASLTRPDALFLSVAAQLNHPQLSAIQDWLVRHVMVQPSETFGPVLTARMVMPEPSLQTAVGRLLRNADLGIAGIEVRRHAGAPDPKSGVRVVFETGKDNEFLEVLTEHRRADGSKILFDLIDDESAGTVRFFELIQPLMAACERPVEVRGADGVRRTSHRESSRLLLTLVGEVVVARLEYEAKGVRALHPADAALNLPRGRYSFGVQRLVVEEACKSSFDEVVEQTKKVLGVAAPKRQIEELTIEAAQDFVTFYARRAVQAEQTTAPLVFGFDATGVIMRHAYLREGTRKAAERSQHKLHTRLTQGGEAQP